MKPQVLMEEYKYYKKQYDMVRKPAEILLFCYLARFTEMPELLAPCHTILLPRKIAK